VARVLVVDDSGPVRELCARMLRQLGHGALLAAGGEEALALYAEHRPDAVLLDVHMPGMDGLAVLAALRVLDPAARVAMVTSVRDADVVRRAVELGASDYMLKPFRADRLDEAVERLLAPGSGPEPPAS
jgi:CheY-like chemotaxis protein